MAASRPRTTRRVDDTVEQADEQRSRVTLWIEPGANRSSSTPSTTSTWISFPPSGLPASPARNASMTMGQPFPDVWLPRETDLHGRPDRGHRRSRASAAR